MIASNPYSGCCNVWCRSGFPAFAVEKEPDTRVSDSATSQVKRKEGRRDEGIREKSDIEVKTEVQSKKGETG